MRIRSSPRLAVFAVVAALFAVAGCGSNDNAASGGGKPVTQSSAGAGCGSASLSGAGSSFQAPMQQQWIADYLARCSAKITYSSIGSGAGIEQFGQGTIDFAGSDVPMTSDEQAVANQRCGGAAAIHLPVTAGGVAVTYNLAGVDRLQLSPPTLAGLFQGAITKWNDPRIAAENPGNKLPNTPVSVFYRSDGSGTTAVFSQYMSTAAGAAWKLGTGKKVSWPTGQGAKGNEGVSAGVGQTQGGVTYTEQAFAEQKKLPTASISNGGGNYVALSAATVSAALKGAQVVGTGTNLTVKVDYQPKGADAYPISTVSYVIVCSTYPKGFGQNKVSTLKDYLQYAVGDGQRAATKLGFAPLPGSLADKDCQSIASISGG